MADGLRGVLEPLQRLEDFRFRATAAMRRKKSSRGKEKREAAVARKAKILEALERLKHAA